MKSGSITNDLAPFKALLHKGALSPLYRSLLLTPDKVVGYSSYAVLEITTQVGVTRTVCVDSATFLAVVASLPGQEELTLTHADGALEWKCGTARGRLALVALDKFPDMPAFPSGRPGATPTEEFIDALELGALSCGNESLQSVGLYGVVIDSRDMDSANGPSVYSTDNTTSSCATPAPVTGWEAPDLVTLTPAAVGLLASLLVPGEGRLLLDATTVYYEDAITRCVIKQVPPLKHDVREILQRYAQADLRVPLPRERAAAFIKRATTLSETKKNLFVQLTAQNGQISLSFADGVTSSDEYYLIDGLRDMPATFTITVDAIKMARALAHTDEIVLDHLERHVLVLVRDLKGLFDYIISGRR